MNEKEALNYAVTILKPYMPSVTTLQLAKLSNLDNIEHVSTIEDCYKIAEVAKKLHCSVRHVWNLIERGELQTVKIGGITRIKQSEIEKLIA